MKNFESHLSNYEARLRKKFMYMEEKVSHNKRIGQYLNNQLYNNRDKKK